MRFRHQMLAEELFDRSDLFGAGKFRTAVTTAWDGDECGFDACTC